MWCSRVLDVSVVWLRWITAATKAPASSCSADACGPADEVNASDEEDAADEVDAADSLLTWVVSTTLGALRKKVKSTPMTPINYMHIILRAAHC